MINFRILGSAHLLANQNVALRSVFGLSFLKKKILDPVEFLTHFLCACGRLWDAVIHVLALWNKETEHANEL